MKIELASMWLEKGKSCFYYNGKKKSYSEVQVVIFSACEGGETRAIHTLTMSIDPKTTVVVSMTAVRVR